MKTDAKSWRGLSRGKTAKDFDRRALAEGTRVELEHTQNRRLAERIAMDHLTEDRHYYRRLRAMEKRARRRST